MGFKLSNFFITGQQTLLEAMQRFEQNCTGVLFVVDSEQRLLGTITDGDIRRAILQGKSLGLSIRIIMNANPVTLPYGADLKRELRTLLAQKGYYSLVPIVDDNNRVLDYVQTKDMLPLPEPEGTVATSKKVLVVGGAGYIGSTLVRYLLENNYHVRVFDAMLYGDEPIRELYQHESFECVIGDTRNLKQVYQALDGIEIVVHLGEVVGDPACALDESYTTAVNHSATESLAKLCADRGVKRFIYVSSCSVYGFGEDTFDETSTPNPVSLYGRTKLECEHTILGLKAPDFCPTILRLATVFGWSFRQRFDLVVNYFAQQAAREKKIRVTGGAQWRPFVHVTDIARAVLAVLKAKATDVDHEIFNVGGNDLNMTISDLSKLVVRAFPDTTVDFDGEDRDSRNYRVRFDKIWNRLGFVPHVSLLEGLNEIGEQLHSGAYSGQSYPNSNNLRVLHPG